MSAAPWEGLYCARGRFRTAWPSLFRSAARIVARGGVDATVRASRRPAGAWVSVPRAYDSRYRVPRRSRNATRAVGLPRAREASRLEGVFSCAIGERTGAGSCLAKELAGNICSRREERRRPWAVIADMLKNAPSQRREPEGNSGTRPLGTVAAGTRRPHTAGYPVRESVVGT